MANRELVPEFDLADRMRKALRTAGVGSSEIAEYLGVARTTVSNWINGHVQPSMQTLRLWAMRTGVSLEWLRTGENPHQLEADEGVSAMLPRLDSNQQPAGYRPELTRADLALIA